VPLKDGEKRGLYQGQHQCVRDPNHGATGKQPALHGGWPVFDKTGMEGNFDILLIFDVYAFGPECACRYDQPSVYTALQQQLGLRLEQQKTSMPVIVVDSIQHPSEN